VAAAASLTRLPTMLRAYVRGVGDNFGWRFLAVLASAYVGVKGLVNILTISNFLPYFRDVLDIRGAQYQALFTVARLPSSLKALIGMLSDTVPIGGYHKRYYIVLAGLMGGLACVLLAVLPLQDFGGGALAASLVFLVSLEAATGTCGSGRGGEQGRPQTRCSLVRAGG